MVVLFALFGWFSFRPYISYEHHGPFYTHLRFEPAIGFAAIGAGAATFLVVGWLIVGGARSGALKKGWAAVGLLVLAAAGMAISWLIVSVLRVATPHRGQFEGVHLFQGEHGWWLLIAPFWTFWIVLCGYAGFLIGMFRKGKPEADRTSGG